MEPSEDNPFLDRLASARLTARELDVARFYEDNLPGAALLNLEEICRAVGVSSATVGRFARKLGYSDFRTLSRSLRAGVREELSLPVERLRRMHDDAAPSPQSVLEQRVGSAQEVLSGCSSAIDTEAFTRACELVGDADRPLYLGAVATGRPLMQYFGLLLSYLRGGVTILDGTDHWAHALAGLEADAVVLAATFDRHPAPVEALLRLDPPDPSAHRAARAPGGHPSDDAASHPGGDVPDTGGHTRRSRGDSGRGGGRAPRAPPRRDGRGDLHPHARLPVAAPPAGELRLSRCAIAPVPVDVSEERALVYFHNPIASSLN